MSYNEGSTLISPKGDIYVIHELVSRGGFSSVYTAHMHPNKSILYAIKVIDKRRYIDKTPSERRRKIFFDGLKREESISMMVDNPYILKTKEVIDNKLQWCCIMDYIEGGELFEVLKTFGKLSTSQNILIITQLCEALKYLHEKKICHRDIKPENILCTMSEEPFDIKLCDFGLACDFSNDVMDSPCGTAHYAAPEVMRNNGEYTHMCDMWSVGVLSFVLLTVSFPFDGKTQDEVKRNVMNNNIDWEIFYEREQCEEAYDFVSKLLVQNPEERMTAEMCLDHPFLHLLDVGEDIEIPVELVSDMDFYAEL